MNEGRDNYSTLRVQATLRSLRKNRKVEDRIISSSFSSPCTLYPDGHNVSVVFFLYFFQTKNPETQRFRGRQNRRKKSTNKKHLLLSGLYRRPWNFTRSCARWRSWVITTDRELGSASRTLPRRIYEIVETKYSPAGRGRQEEGRQGVVNAYCPTFRFRTESIWLRGTTRGACRRC